MAANASDFRIICGGHLDRGCILSASLSSGLCSLTERLSLPNPLKTRLVKSPVCTTPTALHFLDIASTPTFLLHRLGHAAADVGLSALAFEL